MQRQSLGSPASNLHGHLHRLPVSRDEVISAEEYSRRKVQLLDPSPSSLYDDKQTKPHRLSNSPLQPGRLVHLIPVLMLFCFLVLYLCSHSPSRSDLAEFRTQKLPPKHIASAELNEIGRLVDVQEGDVLAIRSQRNLQEVEKRVPKSRTHRKIGDF